MATLMADHRLCVLGFLFMIIFFSWMDISLYYKVQELRPQELVITSTGIPASIINPNPTNIFDNNNSNGVSSAPNAASGLSVISNDRVPTKKNNEPVHLFSPFRGLSVKMMMMDQVNNYIFTPLAEIFNDATQFSRNFSFITPNMISFIGVIWAFLAAKAVSYDLLSIHRLSVFFFQIRTFCDALDGIVARDHLGIKQHISLHNTSGYLVDGIADSIGFAAYLFGCYIYLRRNLPKFRIHSHQYLPLQIYDGSINNGKPNHSTQYMSPKLLWTTRQVFFVVLCFALQLAISCLFWNRYIEAYHILLESPPQTPQQADLQNEILKSSITWILMWFWRISNAQSLMQIFLATVYVNRLWDFLTWIQYIGFVELFCLAFFTEIHLNHVTSVLTHN